MGYFWWGLSVFVHAQTIMILIAILPYPTSKQWFWIFNNRLVNFFKRLIGISPWSFYLTIFCPCFILHIDSMRSYYKYSSVDYEKEQDMAVRLENRVELLFAQRNYFISGTAMILCILMPRLASIRVENARFPEQTESILKKVVQELIAVVREVETDVDGHEYRLISRNNEGSNTKRIDSDRSITMLDSIQKELEKFNREKGNIDDRLLESQQINHLRTFYDKIRTQDRQNTDANNRHRYRQRLARSRFSSTAPLPIENTPRPIYRYEFS